MCGWSISCSFRRQTRAFSNTLEVIRKTERSRSITLQSGTPQCQTRAESCEAWTEAFRSLAHRTRYFSVARQYRVCLADIQTVQEAPKCFAHPACVLAPEMLLGRRGSQAGIHR